MRTTKVSQCALVDATLLREPSDMPMYQRVFEEIRERIENGSLAPRSRLPSTRALSEHLGVSRNTILVAYDQLVAEGYAFGSRGSGTYVSERLPGSDTGRALWG